MSEVQDTGQTSSAPRAAADKAPPLESATGVRTRRLVVLSFWLLVLFVGVPTWWVTTTVYRASLPLEQMSKWADGKVITVLNAS